MATHPCNQCVIALESPEVNRDQWSAPPSYIEMATASGLYHDCFLDTTVACTKRSIPGPLFVCVCAFDWTGLLKLPQEDHRWFHANWGSEVQFLDNGLNMKLGRWTASRTVTVVFCREMDAAGTGWAFLSGADHSDWWASISFGLTTK